LAAKKQVLRGTEGKTQRDDLVQRDWEKEPYTIRTLKGGVDRAQGALGAGRGTLWGGIRKVKKKSCLLKKRLKKTNLRSW